MVDEIRKRRVYLIPILLVMGILISGLAVGIFSHEPEYGGKKLSEWLELYPTHQTEAADAVRHIGKHAVPYLVNWMDYTTPVWKRKLYRSINGVIGHVAPGWRLTCRDDLWALDAMKALTDLGPDAETAVGELSRLANATRPASSRIYAVCVLGEMGKAGLPALVGVLTNHQAQVETWTPECITVARYIGQNGYMDMDTARLAIPALFNLRKHGDPNMRSIASKALRDIVPERLEKVRAE